MWNYKKYNYIILTGFALILYFLFAYLLERTSFYKLLFLWISLFSCSYYLYRSRITDFSFLVYISILFRFIFLFSDPNLSQDFYRFIWDGNIQLLGINPYRYTPDEIINLIDFPSSGILYEKMGNLSNNHYSNYPPISQYLFQFIAYFNKGDILQPIFALRIIYMFGELFLFLVQKYFLSILKFLQLTLHGIF